MTPDPIVGLVELAFDAGFGGVAWHAAWAQLPAPKDDHYGECLVAWRGGWAARFNEELKARYAAMLDPEEATRG